MAASASGPRLLPLRMTFNPPATDPTSIYRYRDGLYAVDMLTAALCHFDLFSRLAEHPSDLAGICRQFDAQARPADVMLTLFTAMGLLRRQEGLFYLTDMAREHLVKSSPFFIGPYFASVQERPVCKDIVAVLRTGRATNWASLRDEKAWAKAMESEGFAARFTAAMDSRGGALGPALVRQVDCSRHHRLLDIAGGSGVYACVFAAHNPHLRAGVWRNLPWIASPVRAWRRAASATALRSSSGICFPILSRRTMIFISSPMFCTIGTRSWSGPCWQNPSPRCQPAG